MLYNVRLFIGYRYVRLRLQILSQIYIHGNIGFKMLRGGEGGLFLSWQLHLVGQIKNPPGTNVKINCYKNHIRKWYEKPFHYSVTKS